jgi:hypothetical protein
MPVHAVGFTPTGRLALRRSDRRLRYCLIVALVLHVLPLLPSLINFSCTHDRPMGLPGGTGDKIAKGTPEGALGGTGKDGAGQKPQQKQEVVIKTKTQDVAAAAVVTVKQRAERRYMKRYTTDGLRAILRSEDQAQVRPDSAQQMQTALDSMGNTGIGPPGPLGLPGGEGAGNTAAGSPWGSRIGAPLWLYRVRYPGGDWDANPKALPALLREVKLALSLKNVGSEEVVRLSDLPGHRGDKMPSMLFITGTGAIDSTESDRAALKDYLLGGGLLIADSSGGNFERQFTRFMAAVLPTKSFRPIEFDHDVYRGRWMPYKLAGGCPIYRDHGSSDAKAIVDDDGRIMVFFSPGDLGSAWAVVDLGRKRGDVESAFQMGTNLVTYSLMTVRDKRK